MKTDYRHIENLLKESPKGEHCEIIVNEFYKIKKARNIEMNCSEEDCGGDGKHIFKKI